MSLRLVYGPPNWRHKKGVIGLTTSSPTATLGCARGQLLIGNNDALKIMGSAAATASYYVDGILDADGLKLKDNGYLSNAEIVAGGNFLRVIPVKGLVFSVMEDGDSGFIANADIGTPTAPRYFDFIVANPGTAELAVAGKVPYAHAMNNILIDSSTVNSSSSGLLIELLGLDHSRNQELGTPSAARRFLCKIIDAAATYGQDDIV